MTAVAFKGLLARKTRAALTALAIVLGVAMITGTYVLTDTVQNAYDGVFSSAHRHSDVTISGEQVVEQAVGQATVPAALLERVRRLPGVERAVGSFEFREIRLVDRAGRTIGDAGASRFGFGIDPAAPGLNPLKLSDGTWASGRDEVVIDTSTAEQQGLGPGDTIAAKADGAARPYRISGTAEIDGVSLAGATIAAFDVPTAQTVLDAAGRFDSISVVAREGVSDESLARRIRQVLPPAAQARTAAEQSAATADAAKERTGIIQPLMLAFAAVALLVGAFVIFNTISITVAQRTRELATLRTLGASRRQVLGSVLLESLVLGVAGSVGGFALGLGLAEGLNALLVAIGAEAPEGPTVIATRTVVVALVAGVLVTVLAALLPALRATRVPPIAAVREGATLPATRRPFLRPAVAGGLSALGLALIVRGLSGGGDVNAILEALGAGTLTLFIGIGMLSSSLVRPLAAVGGWPSRRLGGGPGRLASGNAVRNPSRTAATAAALMVGLALVTFVASLGGGLRASTEEALDDQVKADYVVTSKDEPLLGTFPSEADAALEDAPGLAVASGVRRDMARVAGDELEVAGVDPATIAQVYRFEWRQGSGAVLGDLAGGAIVDSEYAEDHGLEVGSTLSMQTPAGVTRKVTIKAMHHPPQAAPLFAGVVIARDDFDAAFGHRGNGYTFVSIRGGASPAATQALGRAVASVPEADLQTKAAWAVERASSIDRILTLFYVLLALSVLVSLFGMINTLVLSVFERTREIGMLRAIGMTRRQTRRMIRHESVITALIGAALGLPLGAALAALASVALADEGIGFGLPVAQLVVFAIVAVAAGVAAAVAPARRAARLNVLKALQYE